MNVTNTINVSRRLRIALPLAVGATLLLGACGGDDDSAAPVSTATGSTDAIANDAGDAAGTEPAKACGLLDIATVDAALGISGVTPSPDASLGFFDGCRWSTARTDVPALLVGYDATADFEQVRGLACDGTSPTPILAAGADAVACFGVVVAPAATGVVMVSIDDPADQWDDAAELDLASRFATTVVTGAAA